MLFGNLIHSLCMCLPHLLFFPPFCFQLHFFHSYFTINFILIPFFRDLHNLNLSFVIFFFVIHILFDILHQSFFSITSFISFLIFNFSSLVTIIFLPYPIFPKHSDSYGFNSLTVKFICFLDKAFSHSTSGWAFNKMRPLKDSKIR